MKEITIYTDGSSLGNPGPGGWAAVLIYGKHRKELSGGFRLTTNNRMEILATIMALRAIKADSTHTINIHTDSRLVCDSINKGWATRWQKNGWKRNKKDKALNPDLWELLLKELKNRNVNFIWVEGHAGIEENEVCDQLCKGAAGESDLPADVEYEKSILANGGK
jgi:ribonuclease HI